MTIRLALLAAAFAARAAHADAPPATAVKSAAARHHVPVTLWLVPPIGTASSQVRTNLALSLGASAYARLDGVDIGLAASVVTESVHGLQLTSGVNYSPSVTGAQIALVNVGGDVTGAQIGLVNVATGRVRGAQVGLVNVAGDSTAPIGLVNAIRDGEHRVDLWGSEAAPASFSLKLGGRHVYTILAAGYEASDGKKRWLAGIGIGGHVRLADRLFFEPELIQFHVNEGWTFTDDVNALTSLRLIGGYRVNPHLAVFAGPTLNLLATRAGDGEGFGLIRGARLSSDGSKTTVRAWPGFVAGFQI